MSDRSWFRRALRRAAAIAAVLLVVLAFLATANFLIFDPRTPVPPEWNPVAPLRIADPVTPVTRFKLGHALSSGERCVTALAETGAVLERLADHEERPGCHMRNRVLISRVGAARLRPVETRCEVALRLAYWEYHGLQPAARAAFGQGIAEIEHLSSYNCREIRTDHGPGGRMSLHATAEAIDIVGVRLEDGRRVRLIDGWNGPGDAAYFLRAARDSACRWFVTVLGPDYNVLHADHFHLQSRGWGLCR